MAHRKISRRVFDRFVMDNGWMEIAYKGDHIIYVTPAGNTMTVEFQENDAIFSDVVLPPVKG